MRCALAARCACVAVLLFCGRALAAAEVPESARRDFVPDPASIERFGPAYRYPQAGWIVLHIEGDPFERGYQHGRLLAPEIAAYVKAMAVSRGPKAPGEAWRHVRTLVNALFLRRYDSEYLDEMKGIADGAAAAGASFEGRPIDLVDIVAINADMELATLDGALDATATGLEARKFREPAEEPAAPPKPERCSAFAAVGPATADGKIVFGHITMFSLYMVRHYNVWLDIKPQRGHRVLMQTYPGGIQSGMDYYLNDNGLMVAETTIAQTKFDIDGQALASRIRRVLQYADTIDQAVEILKQGNNGLYSNEWLLGDTNTNEIAMFELGTHKTRLWRSSKKEWFGGTEGFYWGCNNTKDLEVRLETVASVEGRPANAVFHPSPRDRVWQQLYQANKGKISAGFGFEAFTTPPLAAFHSCDAKFTTSDMARDLKTYALFGPPLGRTWDPSPSEREMFPDVRPLVSNDWTVLRPLVPSSSEGAKSHAVDLASRSDRTTPEAAPRPNPVPGRRRSPNFAPAWHGTLLPRSDGDIWLATAFAGYQQIVALERAMTSHARDGKLTGDQREQLDLALFAPRSAYLTAVRRRGSDLPLADVKPDVSSDDWYDIAAGKGVLLLAALREEMGAKRFDTMMDDFGRAHAGKPAGTAEFQACAETAYGHSLSRFFTAWFQGKGLPQSPTGGTWSTHSFEAELPRTLIVYGTQKDKSAQREAAEILQRQIQRQGSNVTVPIKSDVEVTSDDLKSHHLLLIGRPDSNRVAAQCTKTLPISFGTGSFVVQDKTYANAGSSVVVAGSNPENERYSVVFFAGLSAESIWRSVPQSALSGPAAEVVIMPAEGRTRRLVVSKKEQPARESVGASAGR